MEVQSFNRFDGNGYSVTGLGGLRSAIRFAFDGKINDVSDRCSVYVGDKS